MTLEDVIDLVLLAKVAVPVTEALGHPMAPLGALSDPAELKDIDPLVDETSMIDI